MIDNPFDLCYNNSIKRRDSFLERMGSMDEKTRELLLTLIKNLSEPEYVTQRECGEDCIKGKNLCFLIDMIKRM